MPEYETIVTVDLSQYDVLETKFDCKYVYDEAQRPKELIIIFGHCEGKLTSMLMDLKNDNNLENTPIEIEFNGKDFQSYIVHISNTNISSDGLIATARIQELKYISDKYSSTSGQVSYDLCNVFVRMWDDLEFHDPLDPTKGCSRNTITFNVNGYKWVLRNICSSSAAKELKLKDHPVITATLRTEYESTDDLSIIEERTELIVLLLSFALGRGIQRSHKIIYDTEKNITKEEFFDYSISPANQSLFPVVDNFNFENLSSFIESSFAVIDSDKEWFSNTIYLFNLRRCSKSLEIRCALLSILLDRISTYITRNECVENIDGDLKRKMKNSDFRSKFSELMKSITPNWTDQGTDQIYSKILSLNNSLSFLEMIEKSCSNLNLNVPDRNLLRKTRNKLLHEGEWAISEIEQQMDFWVEMEDLVLSMILKLLKTSGWVYSMAYGSCPKKFPPESQLN